MCLCVCVSNSKMKNPSLTRTGPIDVGAQILEAISVHPGDHLNVIGHKRRNVALEHRCIALDHVLVGHLRLVELADHCGRQTDRQTFSAIVVCQCVVYVVFGESLRACLLFHRLQIIKYKSKCYGDIRTVAGRFAKVLATVRV